MSQSRLWTRHCDAETAAKVVGAVTGTLPAWLNGRLVRNGPGEQRIGDCRFNHLFDSMAVLHMVHIKDGSASYTSRFLESDTYKKNHRANRIVVTEFGTNAVPDPCLSLYDKFRTWFRPGTANSSNDNCMVNVLQVKDQLLAMTELDIVRIIDPETLDTKPETLQYSKYVTIQRATAHPHVAEDGLVHNLGFMSSGGPMQYVVVSLKDGKIENSKIEASVQSRWKLNPSYMHSFGITDHYFILAETPMAFNVINLMVPAIVGKTVANAINFHKKEKTRFRIISRKTGNELTTTYLAPAFFNFHFINCFESDGNIIVDVCETKDHVIDYLHNDNLEKDNDDITKNRAAFEPRRYVIPVDNVDSFVIGEELLKNTSEAKISREDFLATASAVKRSNTEIFLTGVTIAEVFMELPRINYTYNMKPYTYSYGAHVVDYETNFLDIDALVKINLRTGEHKTWQDDDYYSSEPVFVPRPNPEGEDDGVLLSLLLHKTETRQLALLVLSAASMEEVARVNFTAKGCVTTTFHGQFINADKEINAY